jgi:hypothetical protein
MEVAPMQARLIRRLPLFRELEVSTLEGTFRLTYNGWGLASESVTVDGQCYRKRNWGFSLAPRHDFKIGSLSATLRVRAWPWALSVEINGEIVHTEGAAAGLSADNQDSLSSPGGDLLLMRAHWRRYLALALLLAGLLCGAAWLRGLLAHSLLLGERLIQAARIHERDPLLRRGHVPTTSPGSFGEALAPHLPRLAASWKELEARMEETRVASDVCSGRQSLEQLPVRWQHALQEAREFMPAVLGSTHASSARAPEGMRLWASPQDPLYKDGFDALVFFAVLAGLDIQERLREAQYRQAIDECLDSLALGRDLSHNRLLGQGVGIRIQRTVFSSCGVALDRAPVPEKERAANQLGLILRGTPSMDQIMEQTWLEFEVDNYAALLRPWQFQRLPAGARRHASHRGVWWDPLEHSAWHVVSRARERLGTALTLGVAERDLQVKKAFAELRRSWNPRLRSLVEFSTHLCRWDDRYRIAIARLELLRAAVHVDLFQARNGRWPNGLAEALPANLKPIDPRSGEPLTLTAAGDTVQAICHRPCGDDSSAIQLVLHPDGH